MVHRLSYSVACGIFPDQGSNPCPLHWQVDSQPLCHQGSPFFFACLVSGWVFLGAGVVCLLQFEYDVPGCGVFKICLFALVFILLGVF